MLFCCFLCVLEWLQVEVHKAGVVVNIGFRKKLESATAFIKINNIGISICHNLVGLGILQELGDGEQLLLIVLGFEH